MMFIFINFYYENLDLFLEGGFKDAKQAADLGKI
jgi:hypothetical protein